MFRRRRGKSDDAEDPTELDNAVDPTDGPDADDADADELEDAAEIEVVDEGPAARPAEFDVPGAGASPQDDDDEPLSDRADGPWDANEVELDDEERSAGRIDLGALVVRPRPGMQVRIEVDQQAQRVRAVTFLSGSSGVQLQAFAAPRSTPIWPEVRREIAADATKRGGLTGELSGPYGPELRVAVPATAPDGRTVTQTTRVVGISGPRWLLRATYFGVAADPQYAGELADVVRETVVVRGSDPMAPREPLPLRVPANAQAIRAGAAANGSSPDSAAGGNAGDSSGDGDA